MVHNLTLNPILLSIMTEVPVARPSVSGSKHIYGTLCK